LKDTYSSHIKKYVEFHPNYKLESSNKFIKFHSIKGDMDDILVDKNN